MGFWDVASIDSECAFLDWGETVTYDPVSKAAFTCTALVLSVELSKVIERNIYSDVIMVKIQHSVFTAQSLSAPVIGDTIARNNLAGTSETWKVVDQPDYSPAGYWTLMLERNTRVTPR